MYCVNFELFELVTHLQWNLAIQCVSIMHVTCLAINESQQGCNKLFTNNRGNVFISLPNRTYGMHAWVRATSSQLIIITHH